MSNNYHYDALRTPPADALTPIRFGNLKGKSDINPQYRYEAMTNHFGPCGTGWGFEIKDRWTVNGPDETVACFVVIELWYRENHLEERSQPIPAHGGSMLVIKDKNGLHLNDEAYKMATTDALGNAMKKLGVAADVYRGMMDGSKYQGNRQQPQKPPQDDPLKAQAQQLINAKWELLTDAQRQWVTDTEALGNYQTIIDTLKGM